MMVENPLQRLKQLGQSPWLDYIRRGMLRDGSLTRLIEEDAISGVTSNPSIFADAVLNHDDYAEAIELLKGDVTSGLALYEALIFEDIRLAADQLYSVYKHSEGIDGYVSLEVSPDLAYDAEETIIEAERLWGVIDRPNLMIKIPATQQGLSAIRDVTALGINVNATLIFSPERYQQVANAWHDGIRQRLDMGEPVIGMASVASFFISRIDTLADKLLEEKGLKQWQGKVAVAVAKDAYQIFRHLSDTEDWIDLVDEGVNLQRLLWASTSTKNPAYPDTKYVDELVAPQTVTTLPLKTLEAFRDHGKPELRIEQDLEQAKAVLEGLKAAGIALSELAQRLEDEGVKKFQDSWQTLLDVLEQQVL